MIGFFAAQMMGRSNIPVVFPLQEVDFDFINEVYSIGGEPVSLAANIDSPESVTENGLEVDANEPAIGIIGSFLTQILKADWTVVIEWEELNTNTSTTVLGCSNEVDAGLQIERVGGGSNPMITYEWDSEGDRWAEDTSATIGVGIHRVAATRIDAGLAMSVDGRAVVTNSEVMETDWTIAGFGEVFSGTAGNDFRVRSIALFAPKDNSELPGLSSL